MFPTFTQWMIQRRNGLQEAKKASVPDYSINRFIDAASDLGHDVNSAVHHGEEEEGKLNTKIKKAKEKPESKEPAKKAEPKSASKKSEPTKPASTPAKPTKPLPQPDFIKKEEDKTQKKAKESAFEALRKIHQDRLKEVAKKLKDKK